MPAIRLLVLLRLRYRSVVGNTRGNTGTMERAERNGLRSGPMRW